MTAPEYTLRIPLTTPLSKLTKALTVIALMNVCSVYANTQMDSMSTSNIKAVTIYQGTASVQRQLPISKTGEQHLIFSCLSEKIKKDSIRVNAPKNVQIGELTVQTLTGEDAKLCQNQGNQSLQQIQAEMDKLQAKLTATETSLSYLQNIGKNAHLNNPSNIANTSSSIKQSAEKTLLDIVQFKQQKTQLQRKLTAIKNNSGTVADKVTQISVRIANPASTNSRNDKLTLNYLVDGAYWKPQYQANLDTESNEMNISLHAVIAQKTGENWNNVPLMLSTVRPSYQTSSRDPYPQYLDLYDKDRNRSPSPALADSYAGSLNKSKMADVADEEAMPVFTPSITTKGDVVEYRLPQAISIASDGRQVSTELDKRDTMADVWVRVVPDDEPSSYWYAKAKDFHANWLDGDMNLYRDGHYVGKGRFDLEQIQKYGLGFGVNSKVMVKNLVNRNVADKKGMLGSTSVKTIEKSYRISNQLAKNVHIEMVSGSPIVQNNDIKIDSTYTPQPSDMKWQEKQGLISWEFDLPAHTSKEVSQKYVINYPKRMGISGL